MVTQIPFVGHHKERLAESIRVLKECPVREVVFVVGEQEYSGEKRARKIAEELVEEFKTVWDIEIIEIDVI